MTGFPFQASCYVILLPKKLCYKSLPKKFKNVNVWDFRLLGQFCDNAAEGRKKPHCSRWIGMTHSVLCYLSEDKMFMGLFDSKQRRQQRRLIRQSEAPGDAFALRAQSGHMKQSELLVSQQRRTPPVYYPSAEFPSGWRITEIQLCNNKRRSAEEFSTRIRHCLLRNASTQLSLSPPPRCQSAGIIKSLHFAFHQIRNSRDSN